MRRTLTMITIRSNTMLRRPYETTGHQPDRSPAGHIVAIAWESVKPSRPVPDQRRDIFLRNIR